MHDFNGQPLNVGDVVNLPMVIKETGATPDYCNVKLETVHPMFPGDRHDSYWFNARQCVKATEQETPIEAVH